MWGERETKGRGEERERREKREKKERIRFKSPGNSTKMFNCCTIAEDHTEFKKAVFLLSSLRPLIIIFLNAYDPCARNCGEHLTYVSGWVLQKQMLKWSWGTRCLLGFNTVKGRRRKQDGAEEEDRHSILSKAGIAKPLHSCLTQRQGAGCPRKRMSLTEALSTADADSETTDSWHAHCLHFLQLDT